MTAPRVGLPKVARSAPASSFDSQTAESSAWNTFCQSPGMIAACLGLLMSVLLILPLFLCMPIWCDITFFDVCARTLLREGAFYRHVFMHSPPGMIWLQASIRAVVGWRTEALRAVDMIILAACIWFLVQGLRPRRVSSIIAVWIAIALFLCYSGATEWAHCQRDMWMLLPSLAALYLRKRQLARLQQNEQSPRRLFGFAVLEGVCWGMAFLMKPFVIFSAIPCLLLTLILVRPAKIALGRRLLIDALGVLAGGIAVGIVSIAELYLSGDWPYFWEYNFGPWNAEYFLGSHSWKERSLLAILSYGGLSALNLITVPAGLFLVGWAIARREASDADARREQATWALLAVFYLGWFFQVNYIQRQFEYQLIPCLLLALALFLSLSSAYLPRFTYWLILPGTLLALTYSHSLLQPERLALWVRCWREASTPQMKDALASNFQDVAPSWHDLDRVARFLRSKGVKDREVLCYHLSTMPLYMDLKVEPSTRFVMLWACLFMFPAQDAKIEAEVIAGPQRYVVSDIAMLGVKRQDFYKGFRLRGPPPYPWTQPVVFRAGRYLVHRVEPSSSGSHKKD